MAEIIEIGIGFFDESMADVSHTWPISLSVIFMALICSLVLLFFIRLCGGCLVITVIVLYFGVLITFGIVCFETAANKIQIPILDDLQDPQLLQGIGGVAFGITAISLIVLLCCIRKVKIGIMVIKTTAEFTQEECQTILVPVFMFVAIVLFILLRPSSSPCGSLSPSSSSAREPSDSAMGLPTPASTGM